MSAFCLLQISINDPIKLKEYTDAAPATVIRFGGQLIFRGEVSDSLSGQPKHDSAVVLEFPDSESVNDWYQSADYQSLIENRDAAAEVIVSCYDESDFF